MIGIKPTHPAIGCGCLEVGQKTAVDQEVKHLTKAVEKMGADQWEDVKHIVESMIAEPEAMTISGIRSPP